MEMWGDDEQQWIGKRAELFRDATVEFGSETVGGVSICGLSHINSDVVLIITRKRGKRTRLPIRKLPEAAGQKQRAASPDALPIPGAATTVTDTAPMLASLRNIAANGMADLKTAWGELPADIRAAINPKGCPDELKAIAVAADAARAEQEPTE
jgi:hypothetical protein